MKIVLLQPRGFCAGVVRAIQIVRTVLQRYGSPVYVVHEIVHNRFVVRDLEQRGAVFVQDLAEVPDGSIAIFSAHGVGRGVHADASTRDLRVIDATCPLVAKVHMQVQRYDRNGKEVVLIGHSGHPEVEGTRGQIRRPVHVLSTPAEVFDLEPRDSGSMAYVTQTTLSMEDAREVIDALHDRFPGIEGPDLDDICYATQNRQNAVRTAAAELDLLIVVGARNSSNSNRLCEVAERHGLRAFLVETADELQLHWFSADCVVGVTAAASAPESLVGSVLDRLRAMGAESVSEVGEVVESAVFPVPADLYSDIANVRRSASL